MRNSLSTGSDDSKYPTASSEECVNVSHSLTKTRLIIQKLQNFFLIYLKQRNTALTKTRCENIIIIRLLGVPVSIDPIYHLCGGGGTMTEVCKLSHPNRTLKLFISALP